MRSDLVAIAIVLVVNCLLSTLAVAQSTNALSIYGVTLSDSYDEVIKNGLDSGYQVEATYVPDEFKKFVGEALGSDFPPLPYEKNQLPGLNYIIPQEYFEFYNIWHDLIFKSNESHFGPDVVTYKKVVEGVQRYLHIFFIKIDGKRKIMSMVSNPSKEIVEVFQERYPNSYSTSEHLQDMGERWSGRGDNMDFIGNGKFKYQEIYFKIGDCYALFTPSLMHFYFYDVPVVNDYFSMIKSQLRNIDAQKEMERIREEEERQRSDERKKSGI